MTAPAVKPVDLLSEQASRLVGLPGWTGYRFECVKPDTILVTGAVCAVPFKSGPRKGTKNWAKRDRSTDRTIAISGESRRAFETQWENETGLCHRCTGTGHRCVGWGEKDGDRYRTCPRCQGSGRKPEAGGAT